MRCGRATSGDGGLAALSKPPSERLARGVEQYARGLQSSGEGGSCSCSGGERGKERERVCVSSRVLLYEGVSEIVCAR